MVWASHKLTSDRGACHPTCDKRSVTDHTPGGTLPTLPLAVHEAAVVKMQACPTDNGQPTLWPSTNPATLQVVLVHEALTAWSRLDENVVVPEGLSFERGQGR